MALRKCILLWEKSPISSNFLRRTLNENIINCTTRNLRSLRALPIKSERDEVPHKKPTETSASLNFSQFDEKMSKMLKQTFAPSVPTHSSYLANYVEHSETLQALATLKVELFTIEKFYPETLQYLVKLDLRMDVKPKIAFLMHAGIQREDLGPLLTKYPILLDPKKKVEDLQETLDYLESKKFNKEQIASLVTRLPSIFHFRVPKLDGMFGFYQQLPTNYETKTIGFTGNSLRNLILRCPQLIQQDTQDVFMTIKFFQTSCGFTVPQIRRMISDRPMILFQDNLKIEILYKLLTREMGIDNELISKSAFVFGTRIGILEPRHFYLKSLGRNKYNVEQPGYLSLFDIVCNNDKDFCRKCETGTLEEYDDFMKTL